MGETVERAGYLPGLTRDEVTWQTLSFGRAGDAPVEVAVPALDEAQIAALSARVRQAGRALKALPVARIVDAIDAAIAQLLDRSHPVRRRMETLLPAVTGYDAEMVRLGLTEYFRTFRKPQLQKFIAEDFANPAMLDSFQPMPKGGYAAARGPDLLVHIWAGNVPGLPAWSLISGLLVKAGTIGKVPSAEPLFAGWFARLLADIEPALADAIAVIWWQGGDVARETVLLQEADCVLAYGGNEALADIRARVPITTRFLPHGHKLSLGLVARETLDVQKASVTARAAACDVARYDQQGCYSPHLFFVERGGRLPPREFARHLAHELSALEKKFPRRALTIAEAGDVAAWRNAEEMKAFAPGSNESGEVLGDPAGAWCVAYADDATGLAPSGLNRTIRVVAIDALDDVPLLLSPYRALLQTAGIAAAPETLFRLSPMLAAAGITRLCALGRMTAPEAGWHHDGRFNLLDLVTLTEIESSAETAAEPFAPYAD